jgi:hypothetical protein
MGFVSLLVVSVLELIKLIKDFEQKREDFKFVLESIKSNQRCNILTIPGLIYTGFMALKAGFIIFIYCIGCPGPIAIIGPDEIGGIPGI